MSCVFEVLRVDKISQRTRSSNLVQFLVTYNESMFDFPSVITAHFAISTTHHLTQKTAVDHFDSTGVFQTQVPRLHTIQQSGSYERFQQSNPRFHIYSTVSHRSRSLCFRWAILRWNMWTNFDT